MSGPITPTLYVSSDAKDTDFTVKVLDVYPDGRAYNLDESIQRMRYRDGYEKKVWMEKDKVYKVTLQPLTTSNYFAAGHRLRIEVSSSNFPRFDRNLNTGGNNFDEAKGVVARNAVHHSKQIPIEHNDYHGEGAGPDRASVNTCGTLLVGLKARLRTLCCERSIAGVIVDGHARVTPGSAGTPARRCRAGVPSLRVFVEEGQLRQLCSRGFDSDEYSRVRRLIS